MSRIPLADEHSESSRKGHGWGSAVMSLFYDRNGRGRLKARGCLGCGECCRHFGGNLRASKSDLEKWRLLGREDLLALTNQLGWIWIDPETRKFIDPCPFLKAGPDRTYGCEIHEVKPQMCSSYPTLAHGKSCLRGVPFP